MTAIGILGGTGPAGRGVAVRLASAGYEVAIGSRDAERAHEMASRLLPRGSGKVHGVSNADAAKCDLVIIATPWESTLETVSVYANDLKDKIVVSMVNAMQKEGREMRPVFPAAGSCAQEIATLIPTSKVVTAFNHLPAAQMEDLDSNLEADVILSGNDNEAMAVVATIVSAMPGLHAIEAGSLALAGTIEAFTSVCISVNIRNKAHSYVKLEGLSR